MALESISKILTHLTDAKARLLEQYKGKAKIEGVLDALNGEIQRLETVMCELLELRLDIDAASGQQLDNIGEIVGALREGRTDVEFRVLLKIQVELNVTSGQPETLISILSAATGIEQTYLQDWPLASLGMGIGGVIDTDLIDFFYSILSRATAAGVRLDWLWCYDSADAFSFDGDPSVGADGFGDDGDPLIGGELGELHFPTIPAFAFSAPGDDSSLRAGFSSIEDNLVGGLFGGL